MSLLKSKLNCLFPALHRCFSVLPNNHALFHTTPKRQFSSAESHAAGLEPEEVKARILDLLKNFDKVHQEKLTPSAHFMNDLGLDSLDTVEVVMAIEEEFSIEIPDNVADSIVTVNQAIDYIASREDAY